MVSSPLILWAYITKPITSQGAAMFWGATIPRTYSRDQWSKSCRSWSRTTGPGSTGILLSKRPALISLPSAHASIPPPPTQSELISCLQPSTSIHSLYFGTSEWADQTAPGLARHHRRCFWHIQPRAKKHTLRHAPFPYPPTPSLFFISIGHLFLFHSRCHMSAPFAFTPRTLSFSQVLAIYQSIFYHPPLHPSPLNRQALYISLTIALISTAPPRHSPLYPHTLWSIAPACGKKQ